MASHLTIAAANPGAAPKASQTGAHTGPKAQGGFAAMLEDVTSVPTTAPSGQSSTDGPTDVDLRDQPDQTPDAPAAAIDTVAPIQAEPPADQSVLASAIDALMAFRTAIENGGRPSQADIDKLNQGLDALAAALGIAPGAMPSLDELAAMATQPGDTVQGKLVGALAPLTTDLLTSANPASSPQLKALGEKLAALLNGLNNGDLDPAKLAALGLGDDAGPLDVALQAALAKLAKPPAITAAAVASTQDFATPKLETSEPALTGKAPASVESAAPATTTGKTAKPDNNSDKHDKSKPAPPDAAPAKAHAADSPNTAPAGPQAQTRIEAMPVARPVVAFYQTSQQQLNLPQIAFELVRQVNDGNSRFQMRLDPPELGRIDVRLDIDKSGQVTARLTVEKAETLDLMQRDQRGLEKALQQAGLDASKTNLEFSLKQNFSGGQDRPGSQPFFSGQPAAEAEDAPAPAITLYRASLSASGVNIIA